MKNFKFKFKNRDFEIKDFHILIIEIKIFEKSFEIENFEYKDFKGFEKSFSRIKENIITFSSSLLLLSI